MERRWEIDALRGLMLVLMTLTHLPTRFSDPTGQPFGYVSAAEGFVLLSGYMAGLVYTRRSQRRGETEMRSAFFKRALKIYLCQAVLLLFLFTLVALLGLLAQESAVQDLMSYYLEHPLTALAAGLLLVYNPPLLDILPMYVLFMLVSPLLLLHGLRQGWGAILAASVALWLGAQFGLGQALYDLLLPFVPLKVPRTQTGAFELLAWQFLWVMGLWLGSQSAAQPAQTLVFPRWMVIVALAVALLCLVWRHAVGQVPTPGNAEINLLFSKWRLGPMRLIDLFALIVLALHFAPWLSAHLPRWRALETLGAASLPVFCAHLMLALLALSLFGPARPERPVAIDLAILTVSFAVLYAVALASGRIDRHVASLQQRLKTRRELRAALRVSADARQSHPATARSRRH